MKHKKGFTLVELLVVIAIITILAGIVAPKVQNWIARSKMARAVAEIRNMDLALTKMLSDSGKSNFAHFFKDIHDENRNVIGYGMAAIANIYRNYELLKFGVAQNFYAPIFYELLRRGKDAEVDLDGEVRKKLSSSYMDIGQDPWGEQYHFYVQPMSTFSNAGRAAWMYARAYRAPDLDNGISVPYKYDRDHREREQDRRRGNPVADDLYGYPAATDLPVYIWSIGADATWNQYPLDQFQGNWLADHIRVPTIQDLQNLSPDEALNYAGGDDINNWDNEAGWSSFY